MRKRSWIALGVLALAAVAAGATYRWTDTPHGRLDYRAALSIELLTFEATVQPNPASDFEMTLPINLAFPLSYLFPDEDVHRALDIEIPRGEEPLAARVYWPQGWDGGPAPVTVYYHGGGFVAGSVELFDALARSLTNATRSIVVSVEYRLAPAHPYPAAVDDAEAALRWVAEHAAQLEGDGSKLLVAGDSAGGNLAAAVALRARDGGGPPLAAQLLFYPATDLSDAPYPSVRKFTDGYGLSGEAVAAFRQAYTGHLDDLTRPDLSPLYASSHAGLPPALLVTAGFDPLTDSALVFADRLRAAGVPVTHAHYPETIHGFLSVRLFSQRRAALERTAEFAEQLFAAGGRAAPRLAGF